MIPLVILLLFVDNLRFIISSISIKEIKKNFEKVAKIILE